MGPFLERVAPTQNCPVTAIGIITLMSMNIIIILAIGLFCFVVGGLQTFSDRFFHWIYKNSKPRKHWSRKWDYLYDRYAIGAGTFFIGAGILYTIFIKYFVSMVPQTISESLLAIIALFLVAFGARVVFSDTFLARMRKSLW
jgi:hypothetical protein